MADFVTYFNFLSFTPTLLIGPIDRYGRFKNSQNNGFSSINSGNFLLGWNALVKGIVFKYICAELIDRYWLNLCPATGAQWYHTISDMYAYYAYLFFDFAGYSWMALGIGKMMGMEVPVNFKNPFSAVPPRGTSGFLLRNRQDKTFCRYNRARANGAAYPYSVYNGFHWRFYSISCSTR